MDAESRVAAILARYREPIVAGMRAAVDRTDGDLAMLLRYHLGWVDAAGRPIEASAGKMVRPALTLLCCEAVGGDSQQAIPAAVAVELLHNFTLIHDDIEDESETRHGRKTLWRVAGVPNAINAGDGLHALAFGTILELAERGVPAARVIAATRILNDACITLCEGQHSDLEFERRDDVRASEYLAMIASKTSALLSAAAALGAVTGGATDNVKERLAAYGFALGLAFQIEDDWLGIWGDPTHTGK